MFFDKPLPSAPDALPSVVIWQEDGRKWLRHPGAAPGAVLSLHSPQGRRLRQVAQLEMDVADLPSGNYLLRVQQPDGAVQVLPVSLS